MDSILPKNDLALHEVFGFILSTESFNDYISDIAELIYNTELSNQNLEKILKDNKIEKIQDIKEELLDLLLVYINFILNDHVISIDESSNIEMLKKYFRIKEGDFYKMRCNEVGNMLNRQFLRLYSDNKIDTQEALHNVNLQNLFDLSYDQYDSFKEIAISNALEQGANISDLDTAKCPKAVTSSYNVTGKG